MTADRSWLYEQPEPIVAQNDAREARIIHRQGELRDPATGTFHAHPLGCDCRECVLDNADPEDRR